MCLAKKAYLKNKIDNANNNWDWLMNMAIQAYKTSTNWVPKAQESKTEGLPRLQSEFKSSLSNKPS